MTPATTAITDALPPEQQGVGSAVNDLARELGGALGIAVLGSVLASTYRSTCPYRPTSRQRSPSTPEPRSGPPPDSAGPCCPAPRPPSSTACTSRSSSTPASPWQSQP